MKDIIYSLRVFHFFDFTFVTTAYSRLLFPVFAR